MVKVLAGSKLALLVEPARVDRPVLNSQIKVQLDCVMLCCFYPVSVPKPMLSSLPGGRRIKKIFIFVTNVAASFKALSQSSKDGNLHRRRKGKHNYSAGSLLFSCVLSGRAGTIRHVQEVHRTRTEHGSDEEKEFLCWFLGNLASGGASAAGNALERGRTLNYQMVQIKYPAAISHLMAAVCFATKLFFIFVLIFHGICWREVDYNFFYD